MNGFRATDTAKNFSPFDIPFGTAVSVDRSDLAKRWSHLGVGVRRPAAGDKVEDIVGILIDPLHGLDPERVGASGSGGVACSGLCWARCVGPVTGAVTFPIDIAEYGAAPSADRLGLVLGGPHAGSVRRFEPGDIAIGAAVAVEDDFVLVRLARPYKNVIGGMGLA